MKIHVNTTPAIAPSPWFRRNAALIAAALIAVALIGAGLARELYSNPSAPAVAPAMSLGPYMPLDQHERHPAISVDPYALLDLHERHPASQVHSAAPLDQHERHPAISVEAALPDGSIGEITYGYTLQNTDRLS